MLANEQLWVVSLCEVNPALTDHKQGSMLRTFLLVLSIKSVNSLTEDRLIAVDSV